MGRNSRPSIGRRVTIVCITAAVTFTFAAPVFAKLLTSELLWSSPPESAPSELPAGEVRRMRVTAYCPCARCCGQWADGITASGRPVSANGGHFVAAPRGYAFGTRIVIPGYGGSQPVPVFDRGGAIRGSRLDVFFPTHQQALAWGVQHLDVVVLP